MNKSQGLKKIEEKETLLKEKILKMIKEIEHYINLGKAKLKKIEKKKIAKND